MSNRNLKINSLIKVQLSKIVQDTIVPSEFGLITVTRVDTVPNLDSSKVWVSAINNQDQVLEALNKKIYQMQKELNKRLSLKKVPKILFRLDENNDYVDHISHLMKPEREL